MKGKRGDVRSVIWLGVVIFAIAIMLFILKFSFTTINNQLLSNSQINQTKAVTDTINTNTSNMNTFDWIVVAIFVGMAIGIIITGWFIGGYPIFMILYFIMLIIAVIAGMIMSNVWETFSVASVFTIAGIPLVNSFGIANNIISNLPIYLAVVGFLGMVAMFVKPYISEGGGDY